LSPDPEPPAEEGPLEPVVTQEFIEIPVKEDYRFRIAIMATVGYLLLLGMALVADSVSEAGIFEKVAAAISGPMGAIWGYYFGQRTNGQ